jgi:phosphate/sulfate permease
MEGSAQEARGAIQSLVALLRDGEEKPKLEAFAAARRKEKRFSQQLSEHLCKTFVTPLEREDIEAISNALYKIPKVAEKFGERYLLSGLELRGVDLSRHVEMLDRAAEITVLVVGELRKGMHLPGWLAFLHTPTFEIHTWVKVCCAVVMGAGSLSGGWRIIKTMGSRLVRLQTIHGFAAQTTAAAVINIASLWGMPLSTTHVISTSIMGVGATKRLSAVRWRMMGRIVGTWILTLPLTMAVGFALMWVCLRLGW